MDIYRFINENLGLKRQERGISIAELARRIGIDKKRLWYVLNGQREMRVDEFLKLCVALRIDPALLCHEGGGRTNHRGVKTQEVTSAPSGALVVSIPSSLVTSTTCAYSSEGSSSSDRASPVSPPSSSPLPFR